MCNNNVSPSLVDSGQSARKPTMSKSVMLKVLSVNLRSAKGEIKRGRLNVVVEANQPDIIAITETWLDKSLPNVIVPGYECVSRRDRPGFTVGPGKTNHGGIAVYRKRNGPIITHLEDSVIAERAWYTVHTAQGPILFGVWYRAPNSPVSHVDCFDVELSRLSHEFVHTLVIGDLNVWQKKWLRFSPENTPIGEKMEGICAKQNLTETVRQPTRGPNLLDLVLTTAPSLVKNIITPKVADHAGILTEMQMEIPKEMQIKRTVWDYKKARWSELKACVKNIDWKALIQGDVTEATKKVTDTILDCARKFIPQREVIETKCTHPWMNERCKDACREQAKHEGKASYPTAVQTATNVIKEEYIKHVAATREKLGQLPKHSKEWWKVNRMLLHNVTTNTSIPALRQKEDNGKGKKPLWIIDPLEKANLLAKTFANKCRLPPPPSVPNTNHDPKDPKQRMTDFMLVRQRWVRRALQELDENKATGPDELPSRILKKCGPELEYPITLLVRLIATTGEWPDGWRNHWIVPLHKKGAVFDPENYRGVHLTAVVSKVAERALKHTLETFLIKVQAFGKSQWAFQKGKGCNDLLTMLTATWILKFQSKEKVGIYLSDISGAFDKVSTELLLAKMKECGLSDGWLKLIASYLAPRLAQVIVNGRMSEQMQLKDMVFQGTVLGPTF